MVLLHNPNTTPGLFPLDRVDRSLPSRSCECSVHKDLLLNTIADHDLARILEIVQDPNAKWYGYDVCSSETMRRIVLKTSSVVIMINRISRQENIEGKEHGHPWDIGGRILRGECLMEIVNSETNTSQFSRLKGGDLYYVAKGEKHSVFPVTEELFTISVRPYCASSEIRFSKDDQIINLDETDLIAFKKDICRVLCSPEDSAKSPSIPIPLRIPEEFETTLAGHDSASKYFSPESPEAEDRQTLARLMEWEGFCPIDFTGCRNS